MTFGKYNNDAAASMPLYSIEREAYYVRKQAHYNEWLMDENREFGVAYPGFPEDNKHF